jgi:excisionase family DNA binding protein
VTLAEARRLARRLPPVITVEQAGELLDLRRSAAYEAARRGEIPTLRFGRRLLVPTAKVLDLLGVSLGPVPVPEPPEAA